jgi:sterol desaturase/sphingolipid hydroxylase (fatty acid hydroxylase superfamily)
MQRAWWQFVVGSFFTSMVIQRFPASVLAPSPGNDAAPAVLSPMAVVARVLGVLPGPVVTLTVLTQALESLAHANVRRSVGVFGERGLVRPRFHCLHHAKGVGHEGPAQGCCCAVLLPRWAIVWQTAHFQHSSLPTGVRDRLAGREYRHGGWQQQWWGLQRLAAICTRRPLSLARHPKPRYTI